MTKVINQKHSHTLQEDSTPLHQDFFYKPRRKIIDWRLLASIDINEITRDNNIEILQSCIDNITFCDITDPGRNQDSGLVKMFQLAQLIIEFLVYSQKFLMTEKNKLGIKVDEISEELEGFKRDNIKIVIAND
jgi:Iguana/Dzip1-like DAZ-interacting protein N-terminal